MFYAHDSNAREEMITYSVGSSRYRWQLSVAQLCSGSFGVCKPCRRPRRRSDIPGSGHNGSCIACLYRQTQRTDQHLGIPCPCWHRIHELEECSCVLIFYIERFKNKICLCSLLLGIPSYGRSRDHSRIRIIMSAVLGVNTSSRNKIIGDFKVRSLILWRCTSETVER